MKKKRRSDIPYSQRLLEKKVNEISDHREHSATIALSVALVKMNDMFGVGYKRLVKFTQEVMAGIKEYYEDTEIGAAHLRRRLEQIGFSFENGKLVATVDPNGEPVIEKGAKK